MSTERKKPVYQIIDGIRLSAMISPVNFQEALTYKPQPTDNFIVSFPKSGSTWLHNIVLLIHRKGEALHNYEEFYTRCPFLDAAGYKGVNKIPRPDAIKTHLPFTRMPYAPEAKYLFIARNPRDVCVSFYYHTKMKPAFEYQDAEFDDFFELFINGEVGYNDYFDHLLSWYPHRNDKNIYYTTYERMKSETKVIIREVAKFLGDEYIKVIEKDNTVMNNILKFSSLQYMKDNLNDKTGNYNNHLITDTNMPEGIKYAMKYIKKLNLPKELPNYEFVRKGIVGDWKSHFSQEQIKRMDIKSSEKFRGTDLRMWWTY